MNSVCLIGRLTKDIDLRKSQSNKSVASFTLAVDKGFKVPEGQPTADFISCVAWNQSAEFLYKYAHQGDSVGVEGRIQTRNYLDQNQKKVYVTEVICERVQITGYKKQTNDYKQEDASYSQPSVEDDSFSNTPSLDISSDDLPFY